MNIPAAIGDLLQRLFLSPIDIDQNPHELPCESSVFQSLNFSIHEQRSLNKPNFFLQLLIWHDNSCQLGNYSAVTLGLVLLLKQHVK